jgi:hypothetical protein
MSSGTETSSQAHSMLPIPDSAITHPIGQGAVGKGADQGRTGDAGTVLKGADQRRHRARALWKTCQCARDRIGDDESSQPEIVSSIVPASERSAPVMVGSAGR